MVSEAYGKFSLGVISTAVGAVGLIVSIFLWKDIPGTVRIFGSLSRSLSVVGGIASLFSGIALLQEVGFRFRSMWMLRKTRPELFLLISILSVLTVVVALVSYTATGNICLRAGQC